MLAPDWIKDRFGDGDLVSVWFRAGIEKGGMPGTMRGWEEHREEMVSFVLFETLDGDVLYLPFGDIYLASMRKSNFDEAKANFELTRRAKKINHEQLEEQLKAAERGGGRVAPASMMPPGMPPGGRLA